MACKRYKDRNSVLETESSGSLQHSRNIGWMAIGLVLFNDTLWTHDTDGWTVAQIYVQVNFSRFIFCFGFDEGHKKGGIANAC
jgi:hypothetical protein